MKDVSIRGVIWYQGVSNYTEGRNYTRLLSTLVKSWRGLFGQNDLPFYYTQIAPYAKYRDKNPIVLPLFWETQKKFLNTDFTGMALTLDVSDTLSIHPSNKRPVGERLAKIALHEVYGYTDVNILNPPSWKVVV